MASKAALAATLRDESMNPRALRRSGFIPAVIYGPGYETRHLQINTHTLDMLFGKTGLDMELNLEIEGVGTEAVVVKELQRDPVTSVLVHVDFLRQA